jgi:hypothetical protein
MKKIIFDNKINLLYLFISFFCLVFLLGLDNISFQNTKWLHIGEPSMHQLGWYFFKNDIWRFPFGSNPNYGIEFGSSIVFSDSIPILALLFKPFKPIISGNFQYFSFWYFLCFFLQLYFSFKIIKKITNSVPHSFIGSFFFLIAPIFIYRINLHAALSGQWLLLFTLYLGLTQNIYKARLQWIFLIILSSLIHFYFTGMIVAVYALLRLFNLRFKKENFYKLIKDFLIISTLLFITLYLAGYFEIRSVDSLSANFGKYKLNLLSIFDPVNSAAKISWSWFLPDIKLPKEAEIEGFSYFGLGQLLMFLFALVLFFNKNFNKNLISIKDNKEIKFFFLVSFIFTLWALSNKISLGTITLLEIPLNKYILGAFSIFATSARMFWIVNYFLLILSIIIIYKCFEGRKSLLIIGIFLTIQLADTSAGLKNYIRSFTPLKETIILKDSIWGDLFGKYKVVKTTFPISWSKLFTRFAYLTEHHKIKKTNIVSFARVNRQAVAKARYNLYDNFRKKNLAPDTVYIVDDLNHLRHLKYLFENENVGFFYRDGIWSMVMNEKARMNDNEKIIFSEIKTKLLKINSEKNINFNEKDNYYGFGWSHNMGKPGVWSEGYNSTLLFRVDKTDDDLKLEIYCNPYTTKKNNTLEFDIYVNNSFNKSMKLNNKQGEKFEILIEKDSIKNNEIKIDFEFKNPIAPFEVLESPDSRKLGMLIKKIKISPV